MESLKNFYVRLIVESAQEELEALRADNAKLIAEVKKMMAERKEYLANKIMDTSDKKLLDRLLSEREQYENHDVYATLYEDAKALIDPHTKASGGELPTSVIQSVEYLFKFWIEHKAEREAMMKQEPVAYGIYAEDGNIRIWWRNLKNNETSEFFMAKRWCESNGVKFDDVTRLYLSRSIVWWEQCDPIAMAQMQNGEIEAALVDAKNDILCLHKLMTNRVRCSTLYIRALRRNENG